MRFTITTFLPLLDPFKFDVWLLYILVTLF
jgi:hypothetical protein